MSGSTASSPWAGRSPGGLRPTLLFDVFGTLGDVARMADASDPDSSIVPLVSRWRAHQLEISWLLSVMERYEDFEAVTAYALDVTLAEAGLELSEERRRALLRNAELLQLHPDVVPTLDRLEEAGFPLAVLSNGSPRMLEALLGRAGIQERFATVISVDEVRVFKPAPAVYLHAARRVHRAIGDVWLVSANPFDAAGAKVAGMKVAKVDRQRSYRYRFADPPDITVSGLEDFAATLLQTTDE